MIVSAHLAGFLPQWVIGPGPLTGNPSPRRGALGDNRVLPAWRDKRGLVSHEPR